MRRFRLAIVGPGRAGKDEVASRLASHHGFTYGGTTSTVITEAIARGVGVSYVAAHALRHQYREGWRAIGDLMRLNDPAALAREVLRRGDLAVGIRAGVEMEVVIAEGLVDAVWWVRRPGIPRDPTLEFGEEVADRIILNNGTLDDLCRVVDLAAGDFFARHAGARHA